MTAESFEVDAGGTTLRGAREGEGPPIVLAHGLTCKHFGGRVREIGFLLIYFQPAFFCNVSDAWLFPEKSKRIEQHRMPSTARGPFLYSRTRPRTSMPFCAVSLAI